MGVLHLLATAVGLLSLVSGTAAASNFPEEVPSRGGRGLKGWSEPEYKTQELVRAPNLLALPTRVVPPEASHFASTEAGMHAQNGGRCRAVRRNM